MRLACLRRNRLRRRTLSPLRLQKIKCVCNMLCHRCNGHWNVVQNHGLSPSSSMASVITCSSRLSSFFSVVTVESSTSSTMSSLASSSSPSAISSETSSDSREKSLEMRISQLVTQYHTPSSPSILSSSSSSSSSPSEIKSVMLRE